MLILHHNARRGAELIWLIMDRDNLDFRDAKVGRLFRSLFFPTLVAMVFNSALNICDGMFVGHGVGSDALAAINIVAPYFMLSIGIGLMFGFGASVIGSIRLSENNVKAARIIMTQAYLAGAVIFGTVIISSYIFADDILRALGSSDRLLGLARTYLVWLLPGFFFFYLQSVGMMLIRLDGSPGYAMAVQVVAAILNIFLDWLMVFPLGMGIKGASVATSVSCVAGGCMVLMYFLAFSNQLKFYMLRRTWKSFRLTLRNVGYMVRIGFATFVAELAIGVMMLTGNYMFMNCLGDTGVAAYSIGCYLFPIIFSITNAVAQSAQPIISFNYGARRMDRVRQALKIAVFTSIVCGVVISAVTGCGSTLLCGLFLPSEDPAYAMAVKGLPLLGTCAIFFALNITFIGYYQSIERAMRSTIYMLMRGIVFLVPCFMLLPRITGVDGLWLAIPAAECLTSVLIIASYVAPRAKKMMVGRLNSRSRHNYDK